VYKIGRCARAGHGRRNLARDVAGLAHATDDHAAIAGQYDIQRVQEIIIHALCEYLYGGGFYIYDFTRKIEGMRSGCKRCFHVPPL
jgi:hypothetical protein